MAFLTIEDLVGSVEIVVFPQLYEKHAAALLEDAKVFVRGRASVEEDKDGKVICDEILTFEEVEAAGSANWGSGRGNGRGSYGNSYGNYNSRGYGQGNYSGQMAGNGAYNNASQPQPKAKLPTGVWIQFPDLESYDARKRELVDTISAFPGEENVVIFLRSTKDVKVLPPNLRMKADEATLAHFGSIFGPENIKRKQ